jgi:hypothetical protein
MNINKLEEIIAAFYDHRNFSKNCKRARPRIHIPGKGRHGLCLNINVICRHCNFSIENMPTYHENKNGARGPVTGTLNKNLLIPVLKSKIGPSDVMLLLSCLNIKSPSASLLYDNLNQMSDSIQQLNEAAMINNQLFVHDVNMLAGRMNDVDIATDTAFNNRPQAGCEAATQSVAIVSELNTSKTLPLAMQVANKLCRRPNCKHEDCKKNYLTSDSISSSESKLAKKNLESIESQQILNIKSVTCDASAQLAKTVREHSANFKKSIQQYTCFVHFMRNVQKHVRNTKLQSPLPGKDRTICMQKLSSSVRGRVRMEVKRIQKSVKSEEDFVSLSSNAIENIIPCFSNNHRHCREKSLVCLAHLSVYTPTFLPYGEHLELCGEDKKTLSAILNKSLSLEKLRKISRLLTTNKCESLHHRIFSIAPKNTIWSRKFEGLTHSAIHSSIFGTGKSILKFAASIGMKFSKFDPIYKHMIARDKKTENDKKRKSENPYKQTRHFNRKKKCNRKSLQNSTQQNNTT